MRKFFYHNNKQLLKDQLFLCFQPAEMGVCDCYNPFKTFNCYINIMQGHGCF